MDSTFATSSTFRFRDHQDADSDSMSDVSSLSIHNDEDDDEELQSMTGKGIKRLCMELVEIKAVSDEDFYSNISASYSAFTGIIEEAKDMEKELMIIKGHISMHKMLVNELVDGGYLEAVSDEMRETTVEECEFDEPNELEAHISSVSETLDVLLSENKIDEATQVLLAEEQNLQKLQLDDISPSSLVQYNSVISERKTMLLLQLTLVAENSRTAGPELQKALAGLCKLGNNDKATKLLLRYYHSRLATGIHNLQNSKSSISIVFIKELSRFVFSMVSQAARSFRMLFGETTAYTEEFMKWLEEEIEVFGVFYSKYVKSMSEISGGLSTAVEAAQFAVSYCSLLEPQGLALRPSLIKHTLPCMKKILQIHMDHFKKVIRIFTSTDTWVLGRYLVSGIMSETYSTEGLEQQPEYCLLTNSGRKFVTLMQAITKDIVPMIGLEMDDCIIRALVDLFLKYTAILEKAIDPGSNVSATNDSGYISTESLQQQVSILANISTLEYFFSITILSIFGDTNPTDSESQKNHSAVVQQELDSIVLFIQETSGRLRDHFYRQFIFQAVSLDNGGKLSSEAPFDGENDHAMVPSVAFQMLFLELRKLDKLIEDSIFRPDWLMEVLRELVEAIFLWASNNKEFRETNEENQEGQQYDNINQFVLDMYFLMEITKCGGYFAEDPSIPSTLVEAVFNSVGLDPKRDAKTDEWAIAAASEAFQRLLHIEETESLETQSEHASEASDDSPGPKDDAVDNDTSEFSAEKDGVLSETESPQLEDEDCSPETAAMHHTNISGDLKYTESEKATPDASEASEEHFTRDDQALSRSNETQNLDNRMKDERDAELSKPETTSTKDHGGLQSNDETDG